MGIPVLGDAVPTRGNRFTQGLGELVLKLAGWRIEGRIPDVPKMVVIEAPHTSNWDFLLAIAVMFALRLDVRWIGKHTLFRWPLGGCMRWIGGVPVQRGSAQGLVAATVETFQSREKLCVGIAPEGTRKLGTKWRSGFYHIAVAAKVPIVLTSLDYGRKLALFGPALWPTGDLEQDAVTLREFYATVRGKRPEHATEPVF